MIIAILLLATFTQAAYQIPDWYPVSQHEVDVCSTWGGYKNGVTGTSSGGDIALSDLTFTITASKETAVVEKVSIQLYRASWYIEPISQEEQLFKVELVGPTETYLVNGPDITNYERPQVGFHANYLDGNFTKIRLTLDDLVVENEVVIIE